MTYKIRVAGKLLYFHTVEHPQKNGQLGCPGLYKVKNQPFVDIRPTPRKFFRTLLAEAKVKHDESFAKLNITGIILRKPPTVNDVAFNPTDETNEIAYLKNMFDTFYNEFYDNLIEKNFGWKETDLPIRLQFFLRKDTKKLCTGNVSFSSWTKHFWFHI